MTGLVDLGGAPGWLGPVLGLAAVVLMWRSPTIGMTVAILSLAIDLTLVGSGQGTPLAWGVSHSLFAAALVAAAARHGIRRFRNWPLAAFALVFLINLTLSDLHPALRLPYMAGCLAVLVLPWCLPQPALPSQARAWLAFAVAGAAGVSALIGMVTSVLVPDQPMMLVLLISHLLQAGEGQPLPYEVRIVGATGNAGEFAMLAFAGLAAALNEWVRTRDLRFGALAGLNVALIVLSGTRGAWLAAVVLIAAFILSSESFRRLLLARRWLIGVGALALLAFLIFDAPSLYSRLFTASGALDLSMRDQVWRFYLQDWSEAPVFGRGIGAGFASLGQFVEMRHQTPHNDLLHFLVSGGIVGLVLIVGAIVLWFRVLYRRIRPNDRPFLQAAIPAMLTFSMTWDLVIFPHTLALFAYLAVLELRPARASRSAGERSTSRRPGRVREGAPAPPFAEAHGRPAAGFEEPGAAWSPPAQQDQTWRPEPAPITDPRKLKRRRARAARRSR